MNEKEARYIVRVNLDLEEGFSLEDAVPRKAELLETLEGAIGYLEAIDKAKGLEEAIAKLITQFKIIQMNQNRLLVRGQDLESASKNWEEAASNQVLEFEPVMEALAKWEKEK